MIISNIFLIELQCVLETHPNDCDCEDHSAHCIVQLMERGTQMKRGMKFNDLSRQEIEALMTECEFAVRHCAEVISQDYPTSQMHSILRSLKKTYTNLQQTKETEQ